VADVALGYTRLPKETYRGAVERIATKFGLQEECLEVYDREVKDGVEERAAAWSALYEWDVLDLMEEPDGEEADSGGG
jgi:hypothetical protein